MKPKANNPKTPRHFQANSQTSPYVTSSRSGEEEDDEERLPSIINSDGRSENAAASVDGGAPYVFMRKDCVRRQTLLLGGRHPRPCPRPDEWAESSEEVSEPGSMCITASAPPWARVRHWSAPERVKDLESDHPEEEGVLVLGNREVVESWEAPLSTRDEMKVISSHLADDKFDLLTTTTATTTNTSKLHPLIRRYAADKPLTWAKLIAERRKKALLARTLTSAAEAEVEVEVRVDEDDPDLELNPYHVPESQHHGWSTVISSPAATACCRETFHGGGERGGSPSSNHPEVPEDASSRRPLGSHFDEFHQPAPQIHQEREKKDETQSQMKTEKTHRSENQSSYCSISNKNKNYKYSKNPHKQLETKVRRSTPRPRSILTHEGSPSKVKRKHSRRTASKAGFWGGGGGGGGFDGLSLAKLFRWLCISLFLVMCVGPLSVNGKICKSIKVKAKDFSDFSALDNCTVIEGSLTIMTGFEMISKEVTLEDLVPFNMTYPLLREVTDFVIVYKADQIGNFTNLFPNLAVIRGNKLLVNWALIIYQNKELRSLGFNSLTSILRGGVKIVENPQLCYVNTIDWTKIVQPKFHEQIVIADNEDDNLCLETCPANNICPVNPKRVDRRLCWSDQACQRISIPCPKQNTNSSFSCFQNNEGRTEICDKECLGGCTKSEQVKCWACKNVLFSGNEDQCFGVCPSPYLSFESWRCISENECSAKTNIQHFPGNNQKPYRIYNNECLQECPPDTKEVYTSGGVATCELCKDCPKNCLGGTIKSIEDFKTFKGCTHINGDLQIQLSGENLVSRLEDTLSRLKVIKGQLKISRVFSLVSLSFFKSLELIKDDNEKHDYALRIFENENLQALFPIDRFNRSVQIEGGKVFMHYNPMLCTSEIKRMLEFSGVPMPEENSPDISSLTNGYKAICSPQKLDVEIQSLGSVLLVYFDNYKKIIFDADNNADTRVLLGYEIHYRVISKATYDARNQTKVGGKDACGGGGWTVLDHEPIDGEGTLNFPERDLAQIVVKPFTHYALFITTLLLREYGTKVKGAQSDMQYILTPEAHPDPPDAIKFVKTNYTSLNVSWDAPQFPNGIIDHYEIILKLRVTDERLIMRRDYCKDGYGVSEAAVEDSSPSKADKTTTTISKGTGKGNTTTTCDCSSSCPLEKGSNAKLDQTKRIQEEDFLNALINIAFTQGDKKKKKRKKRSIEGIVEDSNSLALKYTTGKDYIEDDDDYEDEEAYNVTTINGYAQKLPRLEREMSPDGYRYFVVYSAKISGDRTNWFVNGLKHYGNYAFKIRACHAVKVIPPNSFDNNEKVEKMCSDLVQKMVRVAPKPGADDIVGDLKKPAHNDTQMAWISWDEPTDPNDVIVSYNIMTKAKNDAKVSTACITAQQFRDWGNKYKLSLSGSYLVRVRAVSLNGDGDPTDWEWVEGPGQNNTLLISILVPIVIILVAVCALCACYYRQKSKNNPIVSMNPNYHPMIYTPDAWEVKRNLIEQGPELGKGAFAIVYRGRFRHPEKGEIEVAMKTPKESATYPECMQFLHEAHLMKEFDTEHVIKLIGVVSNHMPYWVLLEYMALGDLKSYLRTRRPGSEYNLDNSKAPTTTEVKQMALDIADGMAYLSTRPKAVLHRDLAARNCLVSADKVIKIADFGMAREIYTCDYYRKTDQGKMPVRWLAPESLRGEANKSSDVWSFGIVLWEMVTLADQPYKGMENDEVMDFIGRGGTLQKPERCPDELYDLMKQCWQPWGRNRPSFLDICELLLPIASERFKARSFFTSEEGKKMVEKEAEERRVAAEEAELAAAAREAANEETPLTGNGNGNSGGNHSGNGDIHASNASTNTASGTAGGRLENGHATNLFDNDDMRSFNRQTSTPVVTFRQAGGGGGGGGDTSTSSSKPLLSKWAIQMGNPIVNGWRKKHKSGSASGEA